MAFVSEQARDMSFQGDAKKILATEHLGPGTYEPQKQKKNLTQNLVAFNHREKRESPSFMINGSSKNNPGPGDYKQVHKCINEKTNLISRMKKNALNQPGFTSSVIRLPKDYNSRTSESNVGPGSYNHDKTPSQTRKYEKPKSFVGRHAGTSPQATTSPTPGSLNYIPSVGSTNKVGPGSYQMNILSKNERGSYVKDWSLEKKDRFKKDAAIPENGHNKIVGPGYYDVVHKPFSQVSQHQINRNAAFASESRRNAFQQDEGLTQEKLTAIKKLDRGVRRGKQSLQRNNSGSVQRNAFEPGQTSMVDEVLADENIAKITPGPGHYVDQEHLSSFNLKPSPPTEKQTFGFSNKRFEPNTYTEDMHLDRVRGPGLYHNDSLPLKRRNQSQAGFASTQKREINLGNNPSSEYVGPGQYESQKMGSGIPTFNKHVGKKSFGILQKRFSMGKQDKIPGPGDYMPDRSIELISNKKVQIDNQSSMFMNQQPRLPEPVSITPAPGVYGFSKDEIANSINKKATKGAKTLHQSSSQQISKSLAGAKFDSHQPPQNENKSYQQYVDSKRGPGSYSIAQSTSAASISQSHYGSPNRPKGLVKAGRMLIASESETKVGGSSRNIHASHGTFTLQPKILEEGSRNSNPGPGQYEIGIQRTLGANKSFNLKYL